MTLRQQIIGGLSILIAILLIVILGGVTGIKTMKNGIEEFSVMSDVDMVMNEDIIQAQQNVRLAFGEWHTTGKEEYWKDVIQNLRQFEAGVGGWAQKAKASLPKATGLIEILQKRSSEFAASIKVARQRHELFQKKFWKTLNDIQQAIEDTENVMERVIDPAKEAAVKAGIAKQIAHWSDIDMAMNEDIIQNLLHLESTMRSFLRLIEEEEEEEEIVARIERVREGIEHFRSLVGGIAELENFARDLQEQAKQMRKNIDDMLFLAKEMKKAAKDLDFEKATLLRDEVKALRKLL